MKIVIDIPDEDYKFIKDLQFYNSGRRNGKTIERNVINAIKNGTPYEEKPQGEWIMEENNKDYPDGRATCSCCGYKMNVKRWEWLPAVRWYLKPNYCPECGADMRKGGGE